MKLSPVYNPASLSTNKVYQIEGVSYEFIQKTGEGKNIKYIFSPLPKQGRTTEVFLNQNKLILDCVEVEGMTCNPSKMENNSVQTKLF
jgi:hypothetical protein